MNYWCPRCDVYGAGDACWMCGLGQVIWGVSPGTTSGHRHDPSRQHANIGNLSVPIDAPTTPLR
ncbi:MAG: hypothetical protein KC729_21000 [Candidatus Eisenbacteria bacterium]|uniref:Uncharacterized protein n=1 Tax=Eiseniibacteriota bacterium TaxID=2212470 RepID=A0A956M5E0_UNCEI|nr:hypothetical protein [Candidatus Eisenbacteria bacterium]